MGLGVRHPLSSGTKQIASHSEAPANLANFVACHIKDWWHSHPFHHVIDIVPTILEVLGSAPEEVDRDQAKQWKA